MTSREKQSAISSVSSLAADRRWIRFWLLEATGTASFLVCAVALAYLTTFSRDRSTTASNLFKVSYTKQSANGLHDMPNSLNGNHGEDGFTIRASVDVWFALGLLSGIDALLVVRFFNRRLINRFHYFVSQRMMLIASVISLCMTYNLNDTMLLSQYPLAWPLSGVALYLMFGKVLDTFGPAQPVNVDWTTKGCLRKYGESLAVFDVPWTRAALMAAFTGSVGLDLTLMVPYPWSSLVPLLTAANEAAFLSVMKTGRTSRYILLSSPPLQSVFFFHWGFDPLRTCPPLLISPTTFVLLVFAGRLILDIHMHTIFRASPDLRWARQELLLSTPVLVSILTVSLLLEAIGFKMITYAKPATLSLIYLASSALYLAPSAYNVSFERIRFIRE